MNDMKGGFLILDFNVSRFVDNELSEYPKFDTIFNSPISDNIYGITTDVIHVVDVGDMMLSLFVGGVLELNDVSFFLTGDSCNLFDSNYGFIYRIDYDDINHNLKVLFISLVDTDKIASKKNYFIINLNNYKSFIKIPFVYYGRLYTGKIPDESVISFDHFIDSMIYCDNVLDIGFSKKVESRRDPGSTMNTFDQCSAFVTIKLKDNSVPSYCVFRVSLENKLLIGLDTYMARYINEFDIKNFPLYQSVIEMI